MTSNGGLVQDRNYYGFVNNSEDLENAFEEIAEEIFIKSQVLNKGSVVKDVVTKYFNIAGDYNQGKIKVFNVPYIKLSDGTLGFEPDAGKWQDISDYVNVTINKQTIDVTNYDFPENSINPAKEGGNKLVIQIPIVRDPEFIGGNHVETNTAESGIYQPNGETAAIFPIPETDVKLLPITANVSDVNIYLGSEEAKNFTVADLRDSAIVTVNGVTLDLSKPDEDYGIDWQDDYADINVVIVDANGNEVVGGFNDLREDTTYSIKVTVNPIYEGTETSVGTSNNAEILIYYPEITFRDSYHSYGEPRPSNSAMSKNNRINSETKWKNADGVYSYTVKMTAETVPELSLTYALDYQGETLNENNIPVNATVSAVGYAEDVHDKCYFIWKQCIPECGLSLTNHYGSEDSYEFFLHIKQGIVPDTVVIDYGLPVKISILSNDISAKSGNVTAISASVTDGTELNTVAYTESRLEGNGKNLVLANGTAALDGNVVVYTPTNLEMSKENVFYYEYKTDDGEYYYTTVTVIPATNIYYEDSFFTFKDGDGYTWKTAGETLADKFQAEDRPGSYSDSASDADNVYGSDDAYNGSYTYSLGSSRYTSVDSKSFSKEPTAEFTFCGTGFDLFSVTNNDTGAVLVSVYNSDGKLYKNYLVSTYYGYSYENGVFKPNKESKDSLYHVPVISARELGYGTYKVVIKPLYSSAFDPNYDKTADDAENSYDIYIDSVRIYDPAGSNIDKDSVISDAYFLDGEYAPNYLEIRRNILKSGDFFDKELEGTEFGKGSIFIDSIGSLDGTGISDKFLEAGPNNEVYLAKGQAIAFHIVSDTGLALSSVQLGMKVVRAGDAININGEKSEVVIMNTNDKIYNMIEVESSHEMYRRLNSAIIWDEEVLIETGKYQTKYPIVVANISDSIISLTDLKWAYSAPPEAISTGLKLAVSSTTPQQALLATQSAIEYAEKSPFEDECIALKWASSELTQGDIAHLSITTPDEIAKVTVNGVQLNEYTVDEAKNLVWTYEFEASEAGEKSVTVLLYDKNGNISEPLISESITVNPAAVEIVDVEEKSFFEKLFDKIISFFKNIIRFMWGFLNEIIY